MDTQNHLKTHHRLTLITGASEFVMVGSVHLHAIAPINQLLGYWLGLFAFCVYSIFALIQIHHSAVAIKKVYK